MTIPDPRHHHSTNKAHYHHTLIFPKREYEDYLPSGHLENDGLKEDLRGQYFDKIYKRYKSKAQGFRKIVRSEVDELISDNPRLLNKKYRSFLQSGSSQVSANSSPPAINVLIINPRTTGHRQSTIIHCKEGDKITHQFSNFTNNDNLISRVNTEVIKYLTFLWLILRNCPSPFHIPANVSSADQQKRVLQYCDYKEISEVRNAIINYSSTTRDPASLVHQSSNAQMSFAPKKNALALYYDLKTCYKKHQHLIGKLDSESSLSQEHENAYPDIIKYAKDLASQRFVEAIKAEDGDNFKEYAGSKFLGCGIRCSYDAKDPKEVSIERYDYQNAEPKTSRVMYLKIKKFTVDGQLTSGRNYRTLEYKDSPNSAENKQYCFIKITFDDKGQARVDNDHIYASTSQNPDENRKIRLDSLTKKTREELFTDISFLTLATKNSYVDDQMKLTENAKKLKLSEIFREKEDDNESFYDSGSDAESVIHHEEQDLGGFDTSSNSLIYSLSNSEGQVSRCQSPAGQEARRSRAPSPEAGEIRALSSDSWVSKTGFKKSSGGRGWGV